MTSSAIDETPVRVEDVRVTRKALRLFCGTAEHSQCHWIGIRDLPTVRHVKVNAGASLVAALVSIGRISTRKSVSSGLLAGLASGESEALMSRADQFIHAS